MATKSTNDAAKNASRRYFKKPAEFEYPDRLYGKSALLGLIKHQLNRLYGYVVNDEGVFVAPPSESQVRLGFGNDLAIHPARKLDEPVLRFPFTHAEFEVFDRVAGICSQMTKEEILALREANADAFLLGLFSLPYKGKRREVAADTQSTHPAGQTASTTSTPRTHKARELRRDDLWPAIELAQSQCRQGTDDAEVWAKLTVLAGKKEPPFIGVDEEGLQYLRKGEIEHFTRDALRKRLSPEKRGKPAKRR